MNEIVLRNKLERDELRRESHVPREGISSARDALENNLIKVITGPRRAGKSVFAIQMLEGIDFAYLNFDDEKLVAVSDYDELLKAIIQIYGDTKFLLFDEIQNLKNWELFVNRLHRRGFKIIITGSNAHLLSQELATHLTGRYIQFRVFPFSFAEFLRAKGFSVDGTIQLKEKQGLLLNHLNKFIKEGAYPEVVVKNVDAKSYLTTLFDSILFKDIVKRYSVRYANKLSDLGMYLLANHSCEFSNTRLKNILGFKSVHTVEKYMSHLIEAFLIFSVGRFFFKLKEQIKAPKKAYAYDLGIINSVSFKTSSDIGRLIENLVAVELMRRGVDFYYYKTMRGKEVDFALKQGLRIEQLIQVCYDINDDLTKKREVNALLMVSKETECKNLVVLTWDYEADEMIADKKVSFIPLWKWLIV